VFFFFFFRRTEERRVIVNRFKWKRLIFYSILLTLRTYSSPIHNTGANAGQVLIATKDEYSDYVTPPTLRLFSQPRDLPPPPPAQIDGTIDDLAPEHIDPIVGLEKIGRDGSTLYVRPVEDLDFGVDLSTNETNAGLFEKQRIANLQEGGFDGSKDQKGSGRGSGKRDGEKVGKYLEV